MIFAMVHHWMKLFVVYDLFFFVFLALLFLVNTCPSSMTTMRTKKKMRMMKSLNLYLIQHAYCIYFDYSPLFYVWMKPMKIDLADADADDGYAAVDTVVVAVAGTVDGNGSAAAVVVVGTSVYFAYTDSCSVGF